jgi:hypothetical protein
MEIQCLRLFPGSYALALLGFGFEKQGLFYDFAFSYFSGLLIFLVFGKAIAGPWCKWALNGGF